MPAAKLPFNPENWAPLSAIPYRAPNNASSKLLFSFRARHAAIVLGNYIYIHGGEVGLWNGTGSPLNFTNFVNNYTYTIDLSTSWEIKNVVLKGALSAAPPFNSEALWLDETESSFYAYDGSISFAAPHDPELKPDNTFWKFTPSGNAGSWEQVSPSASSKFSQLVRIHNGAYAYGDGLGFALGGDGGYWQDVIPTPGLVMFNSSSLDQPWSNLSTSDYSSSGFAIGGAAHFVPDFGPQGLLIVIGGATDPQGDLDSTESVAMYNIDSAQWTRQKTTGNKPSATQNTCLVGMKGDNGTYEIFMYGGRAQNRSDSSALGSVFVLSLPSFTWQKEKSISDTGRYLHSCNVVGSRQMMVIGGLVINATIYQQELDISNIRGAPNIPDSWPQGIGMFDLTELVWKDNYDADAKPYVTPEIVKNGIEENGFYPAQWASSQVRDWFNTSVKSTISNPTTSNSMASTPEASNPSASNTSASGNHTGAIVGGIVGGVVALALLTIAFFLLLRKKSKHPPHTPTAITQQKKNADITQPMRSKVFCKSELPGIGLVEMSSGSPRELPDHGQYWGDKRYPGISVASGERELKPINPFR